MHYVWARPVTHPEEANDELRLGCHEDTRDRFVEDGIEYRRECARPSLTQTCAEAGLVVYITTTSRLKQQGALAPTWLTMLPSQFPLPHGEPSSTTSRNKSL